MDNAERRNRFQPTVACLVSISLLISSWPAAAASPRTSPRSVPVVPQLQSIVNHDFNSLDQTFLPSSTLIETEQTKDLQIVEVGVDKNQEKAFLQTPVQHSLPHRNQFKAPADLDDSSARGKTILLVGTKASRPFILEEVVRVAKELGCNLFLLDDPNSRAHSATLIPNSHFIPAPIHRRDDNSINAIARKMAAQFQGAKPEIVTSFLGQYAKLTGKIADRLEAGGIPGAAAADNKARMREKLNSIPDLAVAFRRISSPEEARRAYRELGGGKFVIKSIRGENTRFVTAGINSEDAAAQAYLQIDAGLKESERLSKSKGGVFNRHPGIMIERMLEKMPGSEESSVEIIMQKGRPVFSMVSDTKSVGFSLEFLGGSLTFPSQQSADIKRAFIEAAGKALNALGIETGNARVDMVMTTEGPRIIEVNPYPGGAYIWRCVQLLTGISLIEQGIRALLGLRVNPGVEPSAVVDYRFMAAQSDGQLESVEGLSQARGSAGIDHVQMFIAPGDQVAAPQGSSYDEIGEIIGMGSSLSDAMDKTRAALSHIKLRIRQVNGSMIDQTGDFLQPLGPDRPAIPQDHISGKRSNETATAAPNLISRLVLGFFSTFILVQTAIETTSLAVSQMMEPLTQGFMALAWLVSASYGAYALGSFLGGRWIDRYGINFSYRTVLASRTLIWIVLAALFNPATQTVALAMLIPLFSLDYFVHSIGRVAEHKLQVAWFHGTPTASSRFGSFRDFIEYGTVIVAGLLGLAVAAYGFGIIVYAAPVVFAAAALVSLFLNLPSASPARSEKIAWTHGFKTVFQNSGIAKPLLGYVLVNSFLYLLYYIVATAFGVFVTPDPQHALAVSGSLVGLYGIGAILGAATMGWITRRMDQSTHDLPEPQRTETRRALYLKSGSKSLKWAALGLLGSWLFITQVPIASFVWTIFPISPALIAIGWTAQIASIHLDTIMKDRIPKENKNLAGGVVGAIRTITYLSQIAGFLIWGALFGLAGTQAFVLFAVFCSVVAAVYFRLSKSI